jgi:superfamily II DNA or RNA helicase
LKAVLTNTLHLSRIPDEIYSALIETLEFSNPKWLENERMRRWNRGTPKTLKFFRRTPNNGLVIPRGFMRQLLLMARRHGETVKIEDHRRKQTAIELEFFGTLRPFQKTAVDRMAAKDFGTLCAPTGSGKTVMALALIARRRQPAVIIVHTRELAFQWIERIGTFLKIPEEQVGLIGGGRESIGDQITIGMVQSLYKKAPGLSSRFGHVIVDECHRAPSRTFTEAVTAFDAYFMLGLSATPWRRDRLSKLIFWHLGDVHHEVAKSDLVSMGYILDIEVVERPTTFKPYYDPIEEYSKMLSELTADDERNRLICGDIAVERQSGQNRGTCLVLSDRKRHCESLQAILKHKHGLGSVLLTGDLSMAKRKEVVQELASGRIGVLIATGQLIGEGFDHAGLSTLFLTTPVRFSGRLLQYLGRILRPADGIEKARVYDYIDVHVPTLAAAAEARMRIYGVKEKKTSAG